MILVKDFGIEPERLLLLRRLSLQEDMQIKNYVMIIQTGRPSMIYTIYNSIHNKKKSGVHLQETQLVELPQGFRNKTSEVVQVKIQTDQVS